MAVMYEVTGNIWCGVLFHLFNNEFSVITEVLYYGRFGEAIAPWLTLWDMAVMVIGLVSILLLIRHYKRKKKESRTEENPSVFGEQECSGVDSYDAPVDRRTLMQGLKTPGLILFTVLAASSAILTCLAILFTDLEAIL